MSTKRFLEVVEEALGIPEGTTAETDRIADLAEWDSVGALSVIALLDEQFGVSLDAGDLQSCETLGDLAAIILKRPASEAAESLPAREIAPEGDFRDGAKKAA